MNPGLSSRDDVVDALIEFEQSNTSMKTILREMQTSSADTPSFSGHTNLLSLSVVRFRNTIDFLITRSLGKRKLSDLSPRDRNTLRVALYEVRWLDADYDDTISRYPVIEKNYDEEFQQSISIDIDDVTKGMPIINQLSLCHSHPTFLVTTLLDNLPRKEAIHLLKASNQKRSYYIRPNRLYDDHESALDSLEGVQIIKDSDVPEVSRILDGVDNVVKSRLFKDGKILIQDKASVVTVNTLNPQPGQKVWDACAAPGMKTQLISERLRGQGAVIATDVYEDRVKQAQALSKQLNMHNVEWLQADATDPGVLDADKILIDAPCTSTGILQAYPSFKWRLNKETLFALMTIQNKILDSVLTAYAEMPDTEIVFSTCSILPHEGESQIDSAMKRHSIEFLPLPEYGDSGYLGFECSTHVRRLFPHKHNCSGFFIARFKVTH
ncbi:MAG: RsmB/NOP family class I SAM-dependent RNA methyltransferase [Candidatus Thorarchaeota archaeon]|jgi:16S rRNA (cytosine967-C5)-methyltransferase